MVSSISIFYAFLSAIATLIGGMLPLYTRIKNIELRYSLAFASGLMISVAFFDMLPESAIEENYIFLGSGFFLLYFIEKNILIHVCGEEECEVHTIGWVSIIGIASESLIDGIAIATGYEIRPALGFIITLSIMAHELPRGFSTTTIMKSSGYGMSQTFSALAIDAFFTPLGALLAFAFPLELFKPMLAFSAGTFLYIGAGDLMPEAHRRFNRRVIAAVLLGVFIALLIPN